MHFCLPNLDKKNKGDGQEPIITGSFPEYFAKGKGSGIHIPRQWNQAAGTNRFIRPIRRIAAK
jgi:hypothetical protein